MVQRDTGDHTDARNRYVERFPDAEITFGLGDFDLYRLHLERGRLVAGFARTVNLKAETLLELANDRAGGP
jgi:hypothetical protein